jgi:hypothetical protein
MERFWNIVHYFAYRADYKLHLLFNYINPGVLLYKTKFAKKRFESFGIDDPIKYWNDAVKRPDIGLSSIVSGGLMGGLIGFIGFGIFLCYEGIVKRMDDITPLMFIVIMIPPFIINYFLLFKKDKYLKYFKEFDKKPRKWKIKWAWISFGVIFGILVFLVGSFMFMDYRLHH